MAGAIRRRVTSDRPLFGQRRDSWRQLQLARNPGDRCARDDQEQGVARTAWARMKAARTQLDQDR